MNIVEVKGLSKTFYSKVLDDVDFVVKKGTFTALLGKNGSGKSTILNILMGNEAIDSGDCLLFGESLKTYPDHLKAKIGHVSEHINFSFPLPIAEFIPQYANYFPNFNPETFFKHAKAVNIDLNKHFFEYSRGQKMQIVMFVALAQVPELLLIDEITSVLDAFARSYIINVLKEFTQNGGTVVLTTNIVSEVQFFCTDVIFLSKSKIKFQSSLAEIPVNFKKVRSFQPFSGLTHPDMIWSGSNNDGSQSYIVPNSGSKNIAVEFIEDKRAVSLEDLYIYHSQREENE